MYSNEHGMQSVLDWAQRWREEGDSLHRATMRIGASNTCRWITNQTFSRLSMRTCPCVRQRAGQRARACNRRRVRPYRVEAVESRQQRVLVRVEVLEVGWQHAPAYAHHCRDSRPASGPRRGGRALPGKRRRQQARMWEGRAQSRRGCWTLEVQYCSGQARRACVCRARGPSVHSCVRAIRSRDRLGVPESDLLGLRCRLDDELRVSADLPACSPHGACHAAQNTGASCRTAVTQHIHDKHVPSRS